MIVTLEQLPPRIEAVQFDGANVDEVAKFANVPVPEVQTDGENKVIVLQVNRGWMGNMPVLVREGDWVYLNGFPTVLPDSDVLANYKPVNSLVKEPTS